MSRCAVFLILGCTMAIAQDKSDTAMARSLYEKAFQDHLAARYDLAMSGFREAAMIYERAGLWKQWARCTDQLAEAYRITGKIDEAEKLTDTTLSVVRTKIPSDSLALADIFYRRGIVCYSKGDFFTSLANHERAYNLRKAVLADPHNDLSSSLNNLGIVNYHLGRYDQALAWHAKALDMRQRLFGEDNLQVGQSYINIGVVYRITFQLSKALDYYERARTAYEKALGADHPRTAIVLHNIAIVYDLMGDFDQALDFYQKALRIRLDKLGPSHPDVAFSYSDLANLYNNRKQYATSLNYQRRALAVASAKWHEDHPFVAAIYNNMGNNWIELGFVDSAETAYRHAQELNRRLLGDDHPETIRGDDYLAHVFLKRAQPDSAITYADSAISSYRNVFGDQHPDIATALLRKADAWTSKGQLKLALAAQEEAVHAVVTWKDPLSVPSLSEWLSDKVGLETLIDLSQTHLRIFKNTRDTLDIQRALGRLDQAFDLVEQMRHGYRSESSKITLAENSHRLFESGIEAAWQWYLVNKNPRTLELAWTWAERAKAAVLLESIADAQARQYAGLPDSILIVEDRLRENLVFTDTRLQKELLQGTKRDNVAVARLSNELFRLKEESRRLSDYLEKAYPRYHELKYQTPPVHLADVQSVISERQALLHYTVGDSAWYVFMVTRSGLKGMRLEPDTALERAAGQFRRALAGLDFEAYTASAYVLYDRLVRPLVGSSTTGLIIAPDRFLYQMPFEALLTERARSSTSFPDFSTMKYLIMSTAVQYVPSSSMLITSGSKKNYSLLAMAPVFADSSQRLTLRSVEWTGTDSATRGGGRMTALPFTRNEVESIADLFRKKGYRQRVVLDHAATKSNFLSACGQYGMVHIATHGFLNAKNIKLSGIVFSPETDSSESVLYLPEIYNLKMDADLVTLSACKSGTGDIVRGEGIIGLTRALTYAGARRTLASLWPVADRATSELMTPFYAGLLQGLSYPEALRKAKMKLIREGTYAFPGDWASFILMGP